MIGKWSPLGMSGHGLVALLVAVLDNTHDSERGLIYSNQFDGMPTLAKNYTYGRIREILEGDGEVKSDGLGTDLPLGDSYDAFL